MGVPKENQIKERNNYPKYQNQGHFPEIKKHIYEIVYWKTIYILVQTDPELATSIHIIVKLLDFKEKKYCGHSGKNSSLIKKRPDLSSNFWQQ